VRTTFGVGLEWNLKASMQDHGAIDVHAPLTIIGERGEIVYSLQSLNKQYINTQLSFQGNSRCLKEIKKSKLW
jgi:predicted RNA-binding protein Jag